MDHVPHVREIKMVPPVSDLEFEVSSSRAVLSENDFAGPGLFSLKILDDWIEIMSWVVVLEPELIA